MKKRICSFIVVLALVLTSVQVFASDVAEEMETGEEYVYLTDVTSEFDSSSYNLSILHINEYPCMSVENLATFIGGRADGNTLIKDDYRITYTEDERLAEDANGHIMLERKPTMWDGELYVPVSSLEPTLGYKLEYNRFDKLLKISTGTDYPDAEVTIYARDYGAVGDGETDDRDALLRAMNAAIGSGRPAKLVLDEGKTYMVSERQDAMAFFELRKIENFTFEGNGSTIVFQTPTNTFVYLNECINIKFKNIHIDYLEHTSTQGRITSIDIENGTFEMEIEGPVPEPADDEWAKYYGASNHGGVWWFGQLMDPVEDRLKFTYKDHYFIDSINHIEGNVYEVVVRDDQAAALQYAEVDDRFVVKQRYAAYDFGTSSKEGDVTSFIKATYSTDILFEKVTNTGSMHFFADVGLCDGRVIFRECGMLLEEGTLVNGNADGISYWRNRGGIIMEDCTLMNNLDDHLNTKSVCAVATSREDDYTFDIDYDLNFREGDEIILFDKANKEILGTAYLKSFEKRGSEDVTITLDRVIEGLITADEGDATLIYNASASAKGSIIRNNTYTNGRRHAYITRSANSIFEGNKVMNNGGCMLAAMNELASEYRNEGPFPSSFTMRNNTVDSDGMTYGYYPVEVKSWEASSGSQKVIDGFLIENNVIDVPNELGGMYIHSVNELYMLNNTFICDTSLKKSTKPVYIENSSIAAIDGVTLDYEQDVNAAVSIVGCEVDESNIKNIQILGGNTAKPYMIEYETRSSDHITEDFENWTDDEKAALSTSLTFANSFMEPNANALARGDYKIAEEIKLWTWTRNNFFKAYAQTKEDGSFDTGGNAIIILNVSNVASDAGIRRGRGKINYQYDLKIDHTETDGTFIFRDANDLQLFKIDVTPKTNRIFAGAENTKLAAFKGKTWYTVKVTIDYDMEQVLYYLDSEQVGILNFDDFALKNGKGMKDFDAFKPWFMMNIQKATHGFSVDNIDIWSEETLPTATNIRFIDSTGVEHTEKELGANIKTIKFSFNIPIKEETLNGAVTLKNNGNAVENVTGSYDKETNTYTLTKQEGYFEVSDNYTLEISGTVESVSSVTSDETAVYKFRTDKGVFNVESVTLTDTEGAALDVSDLPDNVKVTVTGINTLKDDNICIIIAGYSGDELKYARVANTCEWNIGQTNVEQPFDITGEKTVDTIKAFVWGSILTMTPLYDSIGIPSE